MTILEGKKYWALNVEVFLLNYVDESLIDHISTAISKAFQDLTIPKIKTLHNYLTNEDHFELLEGQYENISSNIIYTLFHSSFLSPSLNYHRVGRIGTSQRFNF